MEFRQSKINLRHQVINVMADANSFYRRPADIIEVISRAEL